MRASRKQSLLSMLDKVHKHLAGAGMDKVFTGDIRFVKMKEKAAGLYYRISKDIRITPDANNSKSVVFTIIHEFGHKHYYEFLSEDQRKMIETKFWELKRAGNRYKPAENGIADIPVGTFLEYIGRSSKFKKIRFFNVYK